jgi:hypothetical protein
MRCRAIIFLGSAALVASVPAWAHHSWSGQYFMDKTVTLQGKITQFEYINPHSVLHMEVMTDQGKTEEWIGEWAGTGKLKNEGISKETLRPGDPVTIFGNPARMPEEHRIHMLGLTRPDGFKWGRQK